MNDTERLDWLCENLVTWDRNKDGMWVLWLDRDPSRTDQRATTLRGVIDAAIQAQEAA